MQGPVNPGTVEWSGENPGIYLKDREDGSWLALAVFFRVVTSPHGRGAGVLVLGAPDAAAGHPHAPNLCITDNRPLMDYLVANFVCKFASFRGSVALSKMTYLSSQSIETEGDGKTFHMESMRASGVSVALRWEQLGQPFAVDVPVAMSATGAHQMYSVFLEAQRASILIDGKPLAGKVVPRDFLGRRMNTAFLAYSETWINPPSA
jgi:hypothetical protein